MDLIMSRLAFGDTIESMWFKRLWLMLVDSWFFSSIRSLKDVLFMSRSLPNLVNPKKKVDWLFLSTGNPRLLTPFTGLSEACVESDKSGSIILFFDLFNFSLLVGESLPSTDAFSMEPFTGDIDENPWIFCSKFMCCWSMLYFCGFMIVFFGERSPLLRIALS